jgi:hypothetical protein
LEPTSSSKSHKVLNLENAIGFSIFVSLLFSFPLIFQIFTENNYEDYCVKNYYEENRGAFALNGITLEEEDNNHYLVYEGFKYFLDVKKTNGTCRVELKSTEIPEIKRQMKEISEIE